MKVRNQFIRLPDYSTICQLELLLCLQRVQRHCNALRLLINEHGMATGTVNSRVLPRLVYLTDG